MTKKIIGFLTGVASMFFGHNPATLKVVYALMVFMLFDIITGLIAMILNKQKFDYRIFLYGLLKKITVLAGVSFGYYVDYFQIFGKLEVSFELVFASAFLMVEVLSNINNFHKMGFDLPLIGKYIKID
jgi:toxin secretion/phage lysis holin